MQTHTTIGAAILARLLLAADPARRVDRAAPTTSAGTGRATRRGCAARRSRSRRASARSCDVFDALLSPRPYKAPWTLAAALEEIAARARAALRPAAGRRVPGARPHARAGARGASGRRRRGGSARSGDALTAPLGLAVFRGRTCAAAILARCAAAPPPSSCSPSARPSPWSLPRPRRRPPRRMRRRAWRPGTSARWAASSPTATRTTARWAAARTRTAWGSRAAARPCAPRATAARGSPTPSRAPAASCCWAAS